MLKPVEKFPPGLFLAAATICQPLLPFLVVLRDYTLVALVP
jgi:hypothetical protein